MVLDTPSVGTCGALARETNRVGMEEIRGSSPVAALWSAGR